MMNEKIYIAGWREGIRNPDLDWHWRLYRGLSLERIPARTIRFILGGVQLPLTTASSKEESSEGFHVWLEGQGRVSIDGNIAFVDLDATAPALLFSVRTKSLYSAKDWDNWKICVGEQKTRVRHIVFHFQGKPINLSTQSRKITDPRELLAWLEVQGQLEIDQGQATVTIDA